MRALLTVPHYWRPDSSPLYASRHVSRELRIVSVRACLATLKQTFGIENYAGNLTRPKHVRANTSTSVNLHIVVCVHGDDHLLDDVGQAAVGVERHVVAGDPMYLGYACHEVLRNRVNEFDYFGYLEDDLVVRDSWYFVKLAWFTRMVGTNALLQPNRFEVCQSTDAKIYIDGDLPYEKTRPYQDVTEKPGLKGRFLGHEITFRRTLNPHAGCFFLSAGQMAAWAAQPYFGDRDRSFFSPLESAATVGVMRTFRVYKPSCENAAFLEVEHGSDAWIRKIAQRDMALGVQPPWGLMHQTGEEEDCVTWQQQSQTSRRPSAATPQQSIA